jgi:hypothetical protein
VSPAQCSYRVIPDACSQGAEGNEVHTPESSLRHALSPASGASSLCFEKLSQCCFHRAFPLISTPLETDNCEGNEKEEELGRKRIRVSVMEWGALRKDGAGPP